MTTVGDHIRERLAQVQALEAPKRPRWTLTDVRAVLELCREVQRLNVALKQAHAPKPKKTRVPTNDFGTGQCAVCGQTVPLRLMGKPRAEYLAVKDHYTDNPALRYSPGERYFCCGSADPPRVEISA